jgi:hypothetical protein
MPPGSARPFQPRRDIHPVTEDVVGLRNDVTLMNADTELNAIVARCSGISLIHPVLPPSRATQCINDTGKFDQQAITGSLHDATPVFGDLQVNKLRPDCPQSVEGTLFVSTDQP